MTDAQVAVRELQLEEVDVRINYFHDASDDYLRRLGVDRDRLPSPDQWLERYRKDYVQPIKERQHYALAWELNGQLVGFSSVDRIKFGHEAFMHLHILQPDRRQHGLGTKFVRLSARQYFEVLELQQLFSEPNAFNQAPNRTFQRAGFSYVFTHETTPSEINYHQAVTRWVLHRHDLT